MTAFPDSIRVPFMALAKRAGAGSELLAAIEAVKPPAHAPNSRWVLLSALLRAASGSLAPLAGRTEPPWSLVLGRTQNEYGLFVDAAADPAGDRPDADIDGSDQPVGWLFVYDSSAPDADYGWGSHERPVDVAGAGEQARQLLRDSYYVALDGNSVWLVHGDGQDETFYWVDLGSFEVRRLDTVEDAIDALASAEL